MENNNLQPKPDSKKYTDLISEIQKWHIKIPKFQRDFVWSIDKTANLLDSILKWYPIGTFILWETNERLNDIKNIGNINLPEIPDDTKVQYVLDWQQRITSLYAAFLGAKIQKEWEKKITNYWEIYVILSNNIEDDDEQIVVSEIPNEQFTYITLNKILNFNDNLLDIKEEYSDENFKKIHMYSQAFSTYDFSTVVLRREDINSAIEVFTRINTWWETLTLFEIMSAKTYDEVQNFDMQEKYKYLLKQLSNSNYDTISSSVILFTISLVLSKNKECKRKTILNLNKQDIIDTWDDVINSIKSSIDYFRTVYRIPVSSILPYDVLLVPFSYFHFMKKDWPTGNQIKYLEEFFWRISLSYRYSSSSESKLAQDIKRIDLILKWERPNYDDIKVYLDSNKDLINANFSAWNSYCMAIVCLLAYNEPKDFQNNWKVILDNSYLRAANSKNYHHFFPKAFLRKNNIWNENSLMNITLVWADLNKRKISAKAPSIYINSFKDENDKIDESLKSHFINSIDDFWINSDDYIVFLEKRSTAIYNELIKRIDLQHDNIEENEDIKELILIWENEKFELKSTLRFDLRQWIINTKLEFIIAKTISAFLNSEWWKLIIWVDDNWNALWLESDLNTLGKSDTDWFELHLRQIVKKYLNNTFEKYLKVTFPIIDNKAVCLIDIYKSWKPIFIKYEWKEEFYVRNWNSSIPKSREDQSEYEKLHW